MAIQEDVMNTPTIATVGLVSTVAVFVVVLGLQVMYESAGAVARDDAPAGASISGRDLLAAQRIRTQEYRWIDREAGTVAVPVDVAMELYLEDRAERRDSIEEAGGEEPGI